MGKQVMPGNKPYRPAQNQRLAPELYTVANQVYFMTIRAFKHQAPFVRDDLNQAIVDILVEDQSRQNCAVFTYCLMPDHLHFLVSPGQDGISVLAFTDQFKGKTTNRSWQAGWQGKLWQPRYYDHIVRAEEDSLAIAEYILNNPVRKGLVARAEEWPWGGTVSPLPL
jgi:putative transposase